jgi:DNA (cytosine-5)-methyltransferase 1
VPTLDEVRRIPWNGYAVASLFAGGGGSSTGYRMAGYRVAYANDVVEEARETYRANCAPYTTVDGTDVREVRGAAVLDAVEAVTGRRELDVLDGSPPCQAFSMAGPREGTWGRVSQHSDGTVQRSDDLFFEYARILEEVHPAVFVAENVSGLVKSVSRGYFKRILADLRSRGYLVAVRLLDAQWLGVPQMRQRLIFVGVREDLAERHGVAPRHPRPLAYHYPLSVVCPDVVRVETYGYGIVKDVNDAAVVPANTIAACGYGATADSYWLFARDGSRRKFTIDEVKAICSFPPDYVLTGSYRKAWTRLGNSVPPLMMRAVAACVRDEILAKIG